MRIKSKGRVLAGSVNAALLLVVIIAAVFTFSACNASEITEGTVVEKVYGNPVFASMGKLDFIMCGEPDYYVRIEQGEEFQWLKITDESVYLSIKVGDNLVYDASAMKIVRSFLGA